MNRRSTYWGAYCVHCTKKVAAGRVAFCSTYFVAMTDDLKYVSTASSQSHIRKAIKAAPTIEEKLTAHYELGVQIVIHRRCLERLLQKAPRDTDEAKERYEDYRTQLLEQFDPLCTSVIAVDEPTSP